MCTNIVNCKRGVLIYTKCALKASPVDFGNSCSFAESCWCEIRLGNSDKLLVGCVYRSPNSDIVNNTTLCATCSLRKICEDNSFSHLLICGDFNLPDIDWGQGTSPDSTCHPAFLFMECVRDCYLTQHVDQPTHFRGEQRPNILDLILTNEEGMISDISYEAPLGKSHHTCIYFSLNCYSEAPKKQVKKFLFDKGDYDKLRESVAHYDWEEDLTGKTCEESWELFETRVHKAMENNIPNHHMLRINQGDLYG